MFRGLNCISDVFDGQTILMSLTSSPSPRCACVCVEDAVICFVQASISETKELDNIKST